MCGCSVCVNTLGEWGAPQVAELTGRKAALRLQQPQQEEEGGAGGGAGATTARLVDRVESLGGVARRDVNITEKDSFMKVSAV